MSLLEFQTSLKFRLRVVGEPWSLILAMKIEELIFQSNTVLLRNNLTENAFGTRPKRVLNAFHLRSICVPFAFHLRSKCVPFAFHFYWNAPAFRVPVTLVSKPDSVGNHRYFPSINQRYFHILCF